LDVEGDKSSTSTDTDTSGKTTGYPGVPASRCQWCTRTTMGY